MGRRIRSRARLWSSVAGSEFETATWTGDVRAVAEMLKTTGSVVTSTRSGRVNPVQFAHCPAEGRDAVFKVAIDLPKTISLLKLVDRQTKTQHHADHQEALPKLQPPSQRPRRKLEPFPQTTDCKLRQ